MKTNPSQIERILLIRLSALGDCVVAIPVLMALRDRFPHAHIAWAIQDNFAPLIRNVPGLDETIIFPRQRWKKTRSWITRWIEGKRLVRHLRMRHFDVTIDVQSNTKSSVLARLSGAPCRVGHGSAESKELSRFFNNRHVDYPAEMQHIILRNLHLLTSIGIEEPLPRFSIPIDTTARKRIRDWLESHQIREHQYDLLFPFCGGKEKEWPGHYYTDLAAKLSHTGRRVILGCGPGEEEKARTLLPADCQPAALLGPRTDIVELVELIRTARLCVGGDTGPLQMAGALNVPSVSLFGPTDPQRSHPWQNSQVVSLQTDPDKILQKISSFP